MEDPRETIPIAIVGMSFRFPNATVSDDSLWSMMMERQCTARDFPSDRLGGESLYHPDVSRGDSIPLRGGHFLSENLGSFDAQFFSISATEATSMDPQSRALLETTYRALENAGVTMESISESNTSVYTGNLSNDYKSFWLQDIEQNSKHGLIGMTSMLAGRISWFFNLKGPCLTLDTACSSSLVGLDLGCQSLYCGTSDMSIVTGCSLLFSPELFHLLSNMGMLSPDGKCFSFDHRANGYGRGEGIAALILKRLPDAIRDRDKIRAVIRATGTNHDGRTPGVTHPSKSSQTSLIQQTYAKAGLSMEPTRYFEAHGTGTPVGDPIEASAIGTAFRESRTNDDPIYVGSVKSNIGHLEGASGLAGVIKAVLILEKGIIPPNAEFEKLNPSIDAEGLKIKIPVIPTMWPVEGLRRVSVNSFGASGTNAHAILDDAYHFLLEHRLDKLRCMPLEPATKISQHLHPTEGYENRLRKPIGDMIQLDKSPMTLDEGVNDWKILVLSASNKAALTRMISSYDDMFKKQKNYDRESKFFDALVYTLTCRRNMLPHRCFAIVNGKERPKDTIMLWSSPTRSDVNGKAAFIFTGQGAQWAGMGRELLCFPTFHKHLLETEAILKQLGVPWGVIDALSDIMDTSAIHRPSRSQLLCTVLQLAVCDLFKSIGLAPSTVIGHSSGEIAAAYCVGALSRESALKVAYYRGLLAEKLAESRLGSMMAVGMPASSMQDLISELTKHEENSWLTVACVNSPENVTVSGERRLLSELAFRLDQKNIFYRQLQVDVAYHSRQMDSIAGTYAAMIQPLTPGTMPSKPERMISSVTGQAVDSETLSEPDYWVQNMLKSVQFCDAVTHMCFDSAENSDINVLIEVGPHGALKSPIREILKSHPNSRPITYFTALKRHSPGDRSVLDVIGHVACHGIQVNIHLANRLRSTETKGENLPIVLNGLPEYPFDHTQTYWPSARIGREFRFRRKPRLDLLGKPVADWNPLHARWRHFLKLSELPWAANHKINGTTVYPGVGMLVMAIEAARQLSDESRSLKGFRITDVNFLTALTIPHSTEGIETQLHLRPLRGDWDRQNTIWEFRIYSCDNNQWRENCTGKVQLEYAKSTAEQNWNDEYHEKLKYNQDTYHAVAKDARWTRTREQFYSSAWKSGYNFGPAFRAMDNLSFCDRRGSQLTADVKCYEWRAVDDANHFQDHVIHPTTCDGILQTSLAVFSRAGEDLMSTAVPVHIESVWISSEGLSHPQTELVKARARLVKTTHMGYETSVTALDTSMEHTLLDARGIKLRFVTGTSSLHEEGHASHACHHIEWRPDIDLAGHLTVPNNNSHTVEPFQQLTSYLKLATFKKPGMKIAHFSIETDICEEFLLNHFYPIEGIGLSFAKYALVDMSSTPRCEAYTTADRYQGLKVVSWTIGKQKLDIFEPNECDLVLVSSSTVLLDVLPYASHVLQSGGRLVILDGYLTKPNLNGVAAHGTYRPNLSDNITERTLQDYGFSADIHTVRSSSGRVVTATKPVLKPETSSSSMQYLILIEPESEYQSQLADSVRKILVQAKLSCEIHHMWDTKPDSNNKEATYIFLPELENAKLHKLNQERFEVLRKTLSGAKGVLWLKGRDGKDMISPIQGMSDGLMRTLRTENHKAVIVTASLERGAIDEQAKHIWTLMKNIDFESEGQEYEMEYRQMGGQFHISRILPSKEVSREVSKRCSTYDSSIKPFGAGPPLTMAVGTPGLFESLHFVEDTKCLEPLRSGEVEIKVCVIGLNFKDLLQALGRETSPTLGIECAGTIHRTGGDTDYRVGDRVCLPTPRAFSTYTRSMASTVARVPEAVSLAHAASIPIQFVTAYHGICHKAQLRKGETILIHSAAGGTGQAAIQIAQNIGGEIYATVGSVEKKAFLKDHYGIPEDHIFYSRNTSFSDGIMRMTKRRGVDVVINSLAGDSFLASWDLIAQNGRFIELGRKDIDTNASLPMRPFMRCATFTALETATYQAFELKDTMRHLLDMFAAGTLRPVQPFQVLSLAEIQKGMRMLQEGRSMGKIVFQVSDDTPVPTRLKTKRTWQFDQDKTYIIAGGTGGLGRAITRWMVEEGGAKYLILLSRSGISSEINAELNELRKAGAKIETPRCDICDLPALRSILDKYAATMPAIAGCIQASMVLRVGVLPSNSYAILTPDWDVLFANMSYQDWKAATDPKVHGAWNLHTALPKGLDFFIMLSSLAGVLGSATQANYAAGNAYMNELARYRVARGERAVALDLGVMLEHGVLANDEKLRERLLASNQMEGITTAELLALLDYCCDPAFECKSQDDAQIAIGLASGAKIRSNPASVPHLFTLPFYSHIFNRKEDNDQAQPDDSNQGTRRYRKEFLAAQSTAEAGAAVAQALVARLTSTSSEQQPTFHGDSEAFSKPLHQHGVDSLVALELRRWFGAEFEADIPIFEILGELSVAGIGELVARKSKLHEF